jgi:hypothetical protein
MILCRWADKLC